jgi:hypothetical protein
VFLAPLFPRRLFKVGEVEVFTRVSSCAMPAVYVISYGAVVEETCGYDEEYHSGFGFIPCVVLCCVVLCCVVWIRIIWNTLYG